MPSPTDYFTPAEVDRHKYIIEESNQRLYIKNSSGGCWANADVIVFGNSEVCIFWQKNNQTVKYRELLLSLQWLERYARYGRLLMSYDSTTRAFRTYTGADGITRKWVVEANTELCRGGGAAYNGRSWLAISQDSMNELLNTVTQSVPTMPQVIFYEMGRGLWDLKLDETLDWELDIPSRYGFWTLGFNGAMTVIAPEYLGVKMNYYGWDAAAFRTDRLNDLNSYIRGRRYNFENTWCEYLLPWNTNQSVNDLMAGLVIYLYENYGREAFLHYLFALLKTQPDNYPRSYRERRAENLVRSACIAAYWTQGADRAAELHRYFYSTLRWTFLGSTPMSLETSL